jgi:hypothetical protein
VLNTSAVAAFRLGSESGSRRDQTDILVIVSFAKGTVDFGAALARDSIMLFYYQADGSGFYEPKALYIGN